MKKLIEKLLITCLMIYSTEVVAGEVNEEQKFIVSNNGTVVAAASKKEITRIVFTSEVDAIESIVGEIQYNVRGKNLYLRTSSDKPVNFFVTTAAGCRPPSILTP